MGGNNQDQKITAHLANERTFLAWLRTSIAIMAFGFVVEKFSLFLNRISQLFNMQRDNTCKKSNELYPGYSYTIGILLIVIGEITCLAALFKFLQTRKQISNDNFQPSAALSIILTLAFSLLGFFLIIYLIRKPYLIL